MDAADDDRRLARDLADPAARGEATRELVHRYGAELHARIRCVVGLGSEADDVFQEALLKILRGVGGFDGRSALGTWLYRVATNAALDHARAAARRRAREVTVSALAPAVADAEPRRGRVTKSNSATTALAPDAGQIRDLLQQAIATLPSAQRRVFEARYFHETPYRQLAAELGTSPGGLKANYYHAVRKVTAYLTAHAPHLTP